MDTFANIQGAIISKGKYFSVKNLFRCHSEWSGQSGTTEFDWADNVGDCCLEDIVTCQRDAQHSVPVCSVSGFDHLIAGM